jgi:transcriptional regulator with XRE-family HTH domain
MRMTSSQKLGMYLHQQREVKGLSQRQLAAVSGVDQSTVNRIERGEFASPSPKTLKALADSLDLTLEEVWSLAGYDVTPTLPGPMPFLRAKYSEMSDDQLDALTKDVAAVLKRHGIDPYGRPKQNEDEDQRQASNI